MNTQRLEFIDFARGFAILSIVIFHYSDQYAIGIWSKAVMLGGTGVHLFFIVSGFGLGLSSMKMQINEFFKKRFTKILLPYYITIALICFVNVIWPLYKETSLYAIGGHLLLYKMFDEKIVGSFGYHFWFISTIIQFYIAFPLIVRLKNSLSSNQFVCSSILISITYWVLITVFNVAHLRVVNSFFLQYLWEFNLGIVLAERYLKGGELLWSKSRFVLILITISGIGLMAIMVLKGGRLGQTFNDMPASIGYLALTSLLYSIIKKIEVLKNFFTQIGKISYPLYLTHNAVFLLINGFLVKFNILTSSIFTSLLIILPSSILLAICYSSAINYSSGYLKSRLAA